MTPSHTAKVSSSVCTHSARATVMVCRHAEWPDGRESADGGESVGGWVRRNARRTAARRTCMAERLSNTPICCSKGRERRTCTRAFPSGRCLISRPASIMGNVDVRSSSCAHGPGACGTRDGTDGDEWSEQARALRLRKQNPHTHLDLGMLRAVLRRHKPVTRVVAGVFPEREHVEPGRVSVDNDFEDLCEAAFAHCRFSRGRVEQRALSGSALTQRAHR